MQEGCKLPSRHGHVTWFSSNAYVHGTPRLFRSPSCTRPPRGTGKQRQVPTRHRVLCTTTVSLGHPAEIHYGASPPRGSPLPPYKVSAPLHTKSEGRRWEYFACLGKTSLKLALSQELSLYKCTKHSLKASHKLDIALSTSRMVGDGSLLVQHFL